MSESEATKDLKVMLGDPKKAVLAMTGPLIISFLMVQVNSFADSSWCSMLGLDASSAVSAISPMYWIIAGIGTGIGVGASTSIARCLGRGDKVRADALVSQTVAISAVASIALTPLLLLLQDPAISMMGAEDVADLCRAYIDPIVICTLPIVISGVIAGILRSEGAAKRSTAMLLVAAVLNISLDPVFMFVLDMGVAGAGWATSISTAASVLLGLWWFAKGSVYLRMSFKGFRFDLGMIRDVMFVGIPKSAETVLISAMSMIQIVFVIMCGGTSASALYSMPWKFVSMSEVVSQATGSSVIPIVSAAMGQDDADRAAVACRYSLRITVIAMVAIAVLLFVFADWAMIPFTMSDSKFAHVLRIYAILIPLVGLIDVAASVLESMRLAQLSMVSSFLRNVFILALMAVACTMSLDAIFWSLVAAEIVGAAMMLGLAEHEFRKHTGLGIIGFVWREGAKSSQRRGTSGAFQPSLHDPLHCDTALPMDLQCHTIRETTESTCWQPRPPRARTTLINHVARSHGEDSQMSGWTYAKSGVNIDQKSEAIKALVDEVSYKRSGIGQAVRLPGLFASLVDFGDRYITMATDGVGSKLLIAEALNKWDTVGIDCIAMNVNDTICVNAEPTSFVDYIAIDEPKPEITEEIGKGLQKGAELSDMEIVGGEIAVLPEIINGVDLSGTCMGYVEKDRIITGETCAEGDLIIGLESSGIHSNGLTLARKVVEANGIALTDHVKGLSKTIGEELLTPTEIYVRQVLGITRSHEVHGLVDITGGGLRNILRMRKGLRYVIDDPIEPAPVFTALQELGDITTEEIYQTLNMSMGFTIIAPADEAEAIAAENRNAKIVGRVEKGAGVLLETENVLYDHY